MATIVGITGVMDSGKTELSKEVAKLLTPSIIIHMDDVLKEYAQEMRNNPNDRAVRKIARQIRPVLKELMRDVPDDGYVIVEGVEVAFFAQSCRRPDEVVFIRASKEEERFQHSKNRKNYSDFYGDSFPFQMYMARSNMQVQRIVSVFPTSDLTIVNTYEPDCLVQGAKKVADLAFNKREQKKSARNNLRHSGGQNR